MDGIARIDRVVSESNVWLDDSFPFAKMKVKVIERSPAELMAIPNVFIRNSTTGHPEYISGLGNTPAEAVTDLLARFMSDVRRNTKASGLKEEDFEWSACEDF